MSLLRTGVGQSYRRPLLVGTGANIAFGKPADFSGSGDGVDTVFDNQKFDFCKDSKVIILTSFDIVDSVVTLAATGNYYSYGQSFTGDGSYISAVSFKFRGFSGDGTIYFKIYAHSGTFGSTGVPTGAALATSFGISPAYVPTDALYVATDLFLDPYKTTSGTNYFIVCEYAGTAAAGSMNLGVISTAGLVAGNASYKTTSGGAWTATTSTSLCFNLYGISGTYSTIKYNMSNADSYVVIGQTGIQNPGITFTGTGAYINRFVIYSIGNAGNGDFSAKIFATSGNLPTGSFLAQSNSITLYPEYPISGNFLVTFNFETPFLAASGTVYAIVIDCAVANIATDPYFQIQYDSSSSSYTGNSFYQVLNTTTYLSYPSTKDMCFYIYTTPLVEAAFDTYDANLNGDQFNYIAATQNTKMAQSFTGIDGAFSKVSVNLRATGSPTGNITASLFADDGGTFGTTGKPTGTALATSTAISASTISATETQYTFTFASPYTMTAGTIYWIAIEYSSGSSSNKIGVVVDISSPTAPGRCAYYNGTTWAFTTYDSVGTSGATDDLCYVLYALS